MNSTPWMTRSISIIILCTATMWCKDPSDLRSIPSTPLSKSAANDQFTAITVNNIFSYYTNNGDGSLNPFTGDGGFEIIDHSRGITIFEDGFVWGGRHQKDNMVKVGGSTYNHGLQAGRIVTAGTATSAPIAESVSLSKNRIYRVRKDVTPRTAYADVKEVLTQQDVTLLNRYQSVQAEDVYHQYVTDWNEWPASDGAPFQDVDGNGSYDPMVDVPGIPGADQTIWYVANDLDKDRTYYLYGSDPIGIEFQRTIWAYRIPGPLMNTVFQKNIIINRSGYDVDSFYVAQWSDADLGGGLGYTDDLIGCDTILHLGFTYNGDNNDGTFGTAPPAIGFDLLQGPLVPGAGTDTGWFKGRRMIGKKNLPMTNFPLTLKSGSTFSDPRLNDPRGTSEWYNIFRSLDARTGAALINPQTGNITSFVYPGDPVMNTGWVDGVEHVPADRRMQICSGPFTFANGDTQEVIVAFIAAASEDRLQSVALLKLYDHTIQWFGDMLHFARPFVQESPAVKAFGLDQQVVLDWSEQTSADNIEKTDLAGYLFQGYNVYQSSDGTTKNAKKIKTFDLIDNVTIIYDDVDDPDLGGLVRKPVQRGENSGIQRYLILNSDHLLPSTARLTFLNNYKKYYYAVTDYFYNPDPSAVPHSYESVPHFIEVVPQPVKPGINQAQHIGENLSIEHEGRSDGRVSATVIAPGILTGHQYAVTFDTAGGQTKWSLTDESSGENKLSQIQYNVLNGTSDAYVVDGVSIALIQPDSGMKDWVVSGTRQWTWVGGNQRLEGFNGAIGNAYNNWNSGSSVSYSDLKNVEIRFAGTDEKGAITDPNDPNASYGYRYLAGASNPPAQSAFSPYIVNPGPGIAYQDYNKTVPLAAYDIDSESSRRLMVGFLENNQVNGLVDGKYWPPYNGDPIYGDNISAIGPREWLFIFDVDYSETPEASLQTDILNNTLPIMWFCTVTRRDQNGYYAGWKFGIITNHINTVNDRFFFSTVAPETSVVQMKADIAKINVYPNPYFAQNAEETSTYLQHVTFTHLPRKATISILNLSGVRVRKLVKDDDSQTMRWDLLNESGWWVASGMYIVYIDMGELGVKTLKLAVIQQKPRPDHW